MIRFPFRERKAAQAAAHLLKLHRADMYYIVLIKLLYLADRHALIDTGQPITGDRLVAMDWGPVVSQTLTLISPGVSPESAFGRHWHSYVSEPSGYKVSGLKADPEVDELSEYDIEVLDHMYSTYGGWDRWVLSEWTHSLPEWQDPHGSSLPIHPEDILRAAGKSDTEIERIVEEAEESIFVRQFLVAQ